MCSSDLVAAWDRRNGLRIWELSTGKLTVDFQADSNSVWEDAALNPDFNRFLIAVRGSGVTVINLDRERPIGGLAGQGNSIVQQLEISPDGTLIAVAGQQGEVSLYEMKSRQPLQKFTSGLASVRVLRFSESGKFLVGGGVGGVFVRNVKDQELTRAEATFPGGGR